MRPKYDYIGRRVSKQVWTHTGGSWTDESTTAFVYDGWNLIEEVSTSSQTASINHYTWGLDLSLSLQGAGGVGGLLALSHVEGLASHSTFHYTFDLNGNVSEVLDSTGTIAAHYEYGPFGELTHEFHSSNSHLSLLTFNFSTKYYDAELKTLYYGYRYYDPTTGRWLNRDPIEEQGGLNLYGFVGNDAVNHIDFYGLWMIRAWEKIDWSPHKRNPGSMGESFFVNAQHFSALQQRWGLPLPPFWSWPAFHLLSHYLLGDGSERSVDINEILEDDSSARDSISSSIDDAVKFADGLDPIYGDVKISGKVEQFLGYSSKKWGWALGTGSTWEGDANVFWDGRCVVLSIRFHLFDPWDFEYDKDEGAGLLISDYDLRRMHDFGYAKEFLVFLTSNVVEIKWKQGDSNLPKGEDYVSGL